MKPKLVFIGYRDWAFAVFDNLKQLDTWEVYDVIETKKRWESEALTLACEVDLFIFVGWSWLVPTEILENVRCLGVHPSDLPSYRGGSPLQNQIIDGITETYCTLMELSSEEFDYGPLLLKERLSLEGDNVSEILNHLSVTTTKLLKRGLENLEKIRPTPQKRSEGFSKKRRSLSDGRINKKPLSTKEFDQMYNYMRCLTEPYPNAYFEDEIGRKIFIQSIRCEK